MFSTTTTTTKKKITVCDLKFKTKFLRHFLKTQYSSLHIFLSVHCLTTEPVPVLSTLKQEVQSFHMML